MIIIFWDTLYFSEMEGPNFYELEPPAAPAAAAAANGEMAIFVHTHTSFTYNQREETRILLLAHWDGNPKNV